MSPCTIARYFGVKSCPSTDHRRLYVSRRLVPPPRCIAAYRTPPIPSTCTPYHHTHRSCCRPIVLTNSSSRTPFETQMPFRSPSISVKHLVSPGQYGSLLPPPLMLRIDAQSVQCISRQLNVSPSPNGSSPSLSGTISPHHDHHGHKRIWISSAS